MRLIATRPFHFERLFVNRRAVLILDPSCVPRTPLVLDISKGTIRVVGFGFDYPSRHDVTPPRSGLLGPLLGNGDFDQNQTGSSAASNWPG